VCAASDDGSSNDDEDVVEEDDDNGDGDGAAVGSSDPVVEEDTGYGMPPPPSAKYGAQARSSQEQLRRYFAVRVYLLTHTDTHMHTHAFSLLSLRTITWALGVELAGFVRDAVGWLRQDTAFWVPNGETEGVKTFSGSGKLASARGDGFIPFPARYVIHEGCPSTAVRASTGWTHVVFCVMCHVSCALCSLLNFLCVVFCSVLCPVSCVCMWSGRIILDVLKDIMLRKEYDETFDTGAIIENVDAQVLAP
jgi:hypothetical protein